MHVYYIAIVWCVVRRTTLKKKSKKHSVPEAIGDLGINFLIADYLCSIARVPSNVAPPTPATAAEDQQYRGC
jgi:hypothetical protein